MDYIPVAGLSIAEPLYRFMTVEALARSGVQAEFFWSALAQLVNVNASKNATLLEKRNALQSEIDTYHREHHTLDAEHYKLFLETVGYLAEEPPPFEIATTAVDDEISTTAGPRLVVPISNARYAANSFQP